MGMGDEKWIGRGGQGKGKGLPPFYFTSDYGLH